MRLAVGFQKRPFRGLTPGFGKRLHQCDAACVDVGEVHDRGPGRVVERAQHARDVLERRRLGAALGQRARRLALEIQDVEVVLRDQDLAEVIVAVNPSLDGADVRFGQRVDARMAGVAPCQELLGLVPIGALELRHRLPQRLERRFGLVAHRPLPSPEVGPRDRFGGKRGIIGGGRQGPVQLGGALPQDARLGEIESVRLVRGRGAFGVPRRQRPGAADRACAADIRSCRPSRRPGCARSQTPRPERSSGRPRPRARSRRAAAAYWQSAAFSTRKRPISMSGCAPGASLR